MSNHERAQILWELNDWLAETGYGDQLPPKLRAKLAALIIESEGRA